MKRPSFQFYPDDWAGNSNLRRCTHEEKGIWIDVMCVLHDQDEYGIARWPLDELARAVGTTKAKIKKLVEKGVLKGADSKEVCDPLVFVPRSGRKNGDPVTLIESQQGPLWYSSRMVVDEYKRNVRGGSDDSLKGASKPSPKGGIGDASKPSPKVSPDPSPSRARPSSPSPSPNTSYEAAAIPPTESRELPSDAAAPADPIQTRALELAQLLRPRGAAVQPSNPPLRRWAQEGVTDAQALQALEIAQQRRENAGSAAPINAGFLDSILSDVRGGAAGQKSKPPSRAQQTADWMREAAQSVRETVRPTEIDMGVIDASDH